MTKHTPRYAVRPLTPEEVYTDRQEFIDDLYHYALEAVPRRTMSTVLLGQRRMGKTEIFKRVVNRLFFEQDHTDPQAVVPVYYSFPDAAVDRENFAYEYVENLLRWYAAFRLRNVELLSKKCDREQLLQVIETSIDVSPGWEIAIELLNALPGNKVTLPFKKAIHLPRTVSDFEESTIVMFLDEFQNTRLPHYDFDIVGFFHEAVESPTCPHFVTGSAMSILAKEILGRGSLFGRFDSHPIEPMTEYWGAELARRVALHYKADLAELMAPVVAHRCGGNPFYITAVVRQAAKQRKPIDTEERINSLLAVDLSSGFIWAELNDQVTRWIQRINEYGITKWVLYLSALEEGDRIEPERIRQQLREQEGSDVPVKTIREVMIRLSRGDLLQYMELGGWFRKMDDPILLDFLKAWGKFEVEGQPLVQVVADTTKQYAVLQRQITDQKGFVGELYLSQLLWNGQRQTFPGAYFHCDHDVTLPHHFLSIRHRVRLAASANSEVDVYATTGTEIWLCESKWWETQPVGAGVVQRMVDLIEKLKDFEGRRYFEDERDIMTVHLWLFAYSGVTPEAESLLREYHIYWSTRPDLDWLIQHLGLRRLPDFQES